MRRDMDLVRGILLQVEGEDVPDLSQWSEEQQLYHMAILIEAELLNGGVALDEEGQPAAAHATRLTWKGHEFLDAARDATIWAKAKEQLAKVGGGVALPVLMALLTQYVKDKLGIE